MLGHCLRALVGEAMAAGEDLQARSPDRRGHPLSDRDVAAVALPGEDRAGHPKLAKAWPQRLHRAGREAAQRPRQPCRAVAKLVLDDALANRGRVAREELELRPALREALKPLAFDPLGKRAIGLEAPPTLGVVLDPRAAGDQDQPAHPLRRR